MKLDIIVRCVCCANSDNSNDGFPIKNGIVEIGYSSDDWVLNQK